MLVLIVGIRRSACTAALRFKCLRFTRDRLAWSSLADGDEASPAWRPVVELPSWETRTPIGPGSNPTRRPCHPGKKNIPGLLANVPSYSEFVQTTAQGGKPPQTHAKARDPLAYKQGGQPRAGQDQGHEDIDNQLACGLPSRASRNEGRWKSGFLLDAADAACNGLA